MLSAKYMLSVELDEPAVLQLENPDIICVETIYSPRAAVRSHAAHRPPQARANCSRCRNHQLCMNPFRAFPYPTKPVTGRRRKLSPTPGTSRLLSLIPIPRRLLRSSDHPSSRMTIRQRLRRRPRLQARRCARSPGPALPTAAWKSPVLADSLRTRRPLLQSGARKSRQRLLLA